MAPSGSTVLFWGRSDSEYSRNRILRQLLGKLGWTVVDFQPRVSGGADLEAALRRLPVPDLVWVPCFRQRDVAAAQRYCRRHRLPLIFDPLISAYDKQVFEKRKFPAETSKARKLLRWESRRLGMADLVLADTRAHAEFFHRELDVPADRLWVVPVGAEETLFQAGPEAVERPDGPLDVLFFGSFIPLQGPRFIVQAARCYQGPPVTWTLVGDGPLRKECEFLAAGLPNVAFEDWVPYPELPARIHRADILLGIFGTTPKAERVLPNKVYQAAACGKPIVTMASPAYPEELLNQGTSGFSWVPSGDAEALAAAVAHLAGQPDALVGLGRKVRDNYEQFLSLAHIEKQLAGALRHVKKR